jgi:hypothetical protein
LLIAGPPLNRNLAQTYDDARINVGRELA